MGTIPFAKQKERMMVVDVCDCNCDKNLFVGIVGSQSYTDLTRKGMHGKREVPGL